MFHPYSVHGGTATLDPQVSGMNGQSRMPEINTFPQSFAAVGQFPGYPTPIQYGYPTGYPTTPFATPVVNAIPNTLGWNYLPTTSPAVGTYPTVNPFAAYANPFTPYVNTINPLALSNVSPIGYYNNPFTPSFQPIVNTWNPYGVTPTYAGVNPLAAAACCPTPASFVNPSLGYHPFMTTPLATTPFGCSPMSPTPWAPYSFRTGIQHNAYQPSFCGTPTTGLTGHPVVNSAILSSCCTPNIQTNFAAQSPVNFSNINNPLAAAFNPFAATPVNPYLPTGWNNPVLNGFNPLFHNTSCVTDPYNAIRFNPYNYGGSSGGYPFSGGFNGWNTPWNWSNVWNQFQTPGLGCATGLGFNSGYHNAFNASSVNPIAAMATATGTPVGPINNPFFSPTNIAHGIPGFSTNVVNPLGAGVCGPVCCN